MKSITLTCPTCNEPFSVAVDPPDESVGIMGATIVDVWREVSLKEGLGIEPPCQHVQTWFDEHMQDDTGSQTHNGGAL